LKKTRELNNIRFGLEIECEFPEHKDSFKLIKKHRIIRGWEMDFDGSLENGSEYRPKDKNKLYYNEDCFDQIKEIIGLIKAHRGHVLPSCGGHVHIDMTKFTNEEIINIVKAFIKRQYYIYNYFNVLKNRAKETTKKVPTSVLRTLNTKVIENIKTQNITYNEDYFSSKYWGLNLQALHQHNTLEFRVFNGSVSINEIKKNIKWAIEFCIKYAKEKE